jgi:prepilin-type N-terminal cleavage/methylation domain-containing protein
MNTFSGMRLDKTAVQAGRVQKKDGLALVELLISMAILGVILALTSTILQTNQGGLNAQQARTNSTGDARTALARISEQVGQAAFIYPSGKTITVTGGLTGQGTANRVTTGSGAMAILIWDGQSSPPKYNAVIFYVAARSSFSSDVPNLKAGTFSPNVLVRAVVGTGGVGPITWAVNTAAPTSWTANAVEGVLADGVDSSRSNLMDSASYSPVPGIDDTYFKGGLRTDNPSITTTNGLITTLGYRLTLNIAQSSGSFSSTGGITLRGLTAARNIPRS